MKSFMSALKGEKSKRAHENPEKENLKPNCAIAVSWKSAGDHLFPDAKYDHLRRFHAVTSSPYVLPADISEQERLILQHRLITYGFGRLFHLPIKEDLKAGNVKVLDCGCGPGGWSREVAQKYPKATIIGLDMAKTVLLDAEKCPNLSFVVGNVLEGLPFEDNTFDAVYQRYLVLGIPGEKWIDVVKELVRVTKPGGYIELVESQSTPYEAGPNFLKVSLPLLDSLKTRGFNMDAGFYLHNFLEEAGAEVVHDVVHSVPCGWGGRFGELQAINVRNGWAGLKPFLSKVLSLSDAEYDDLVNKAQQDCSDYGTFYNIRAVVGRVVK